MGTTAQVSGVTANNFTSPVTYIVTAADSSTQNYVVTVKVVTFNDVPATYTETLGGIPYNLYPYIEALYSAGYTAGCQTPGNPLSYCPTRTFRRDESAVFMLRGLLGGNYGTPADPLPAPTGITI